jgi:rfaE bifunctional protein nucleotidyltransferase chain/domain
MSRVIFCNGAFDLLHEGHIELLKYAKGLGDRLVVGLDSDRRITQSKGPSRPINPFNVRRAIMEQLKPVDIVEEFDSDQQLIELLQKHTPAVRVIGSDWKGHPVVGVEYCENLIYFKRNNGQSTTNTIQSIIDRR